MRWIDLTQHGVSLHPRRLPSGAMVLIFAGNVDAEIAKSLKFTQSESGVWFTAEYTSKEGKLMPIPLEQFVSAYPNALIREMDASEVTGYTTNVSSASPSSDSIAREFTRVGRNHHGEEVHEDAVGRLVRRDGAIIRESDDVFEVDFLKAGTRTSPDFTLFPTCLRGYVTELMGGRKGSEEDIELLYRTLLNIKPSDPLDALSRRNLPQIEVAIDIAATQLISEMGKSNVEKISEVASLDSRLPRLRIERNISKATTERGITPIIAMMGAIMVNAEDKRILLPYTANSVVSAVMKDAAQVVLMPTQEQWDAQLHAPEMNDNLDIIPFEPGKYRFVPESFDALVVAPPLTGKTGMFDDVEFSSPQQYAAATAMSALGMTSRGVVILTGEVTDNADTLLAQSSISTFANWASTHYRIESIVYIDPSIYGRQGDVRPAYAVYVKGRRWVPEATQLPRLDICYNRDDIIAVAQATLSPFRTRVDAEHRQTLSEALVSYNTEYDKASGVAINEFQRPYMPLSSIGRSEVALPINLVTPTRVSLSRYMREHGRPEEEVASMLGMSEAAVGEVLRADQVDAVALGYKRLKKEGAFLLSDQAGAGKGREIASILYGYMNSGEIPLFVTKSSNLHSNLWHEFIEIGIDSNITPFVIDDCDITAPDGTRITGYDESAVKDFIDTGRLPEGVNLIMCTYGTLCRAAPHITLSRNKLVMPESGFPAQRAFAALRHAASGHAVCLDESHLATGDSSYAIVAQYLVDKAPAVLYSSGTWLRTPKGLQLYKRLFPSDVRADDIIGIVRRGGAPLQEVLSQMLVSDGSMLRRELDLSSLRIEYRENPDDFARNEMMANHLSVYMRAMIDLKIKVDGYAHRLLLDLTKSDDPSIRNLASAAKGSRTFFSSDGMEFSNLAHQIANQFVAALKQESIAKTAIDALKAGEKPVVTFTHNGASLHNEILPRLEGGNSSSTFLPARYPDIKDVLLRATHRLFKVKLKKQNIDTNHTRIIRAVDLLNEFTDYNDYHELQAYYQEAVGVINAIPDLAFAPLDYIKDAIKRANYTVGEVSGRTYEVVRDPTRTDGGAALQRRDKRTHREVIHDFNNGTYDALVGTGAITTGYDLHSSARFSDKRQRTLIEAQLDPVISDRIHKYHRVSRADQVCQPRIITYGTGLPIEARIIAMSNEQLRQMSASVSSNRMSPQMLESFELFNKEGDQAVLRVLSREPELLEQLALTATGVDHLSRRSWGTLARKVTGTMILLSVAQQNSLLEKIQGEFNYMLTHEHGDLASGVLSGEVDIKARTLRSTIYSGAHKTHYESEFEKPVELAEIVYMRPATQLPSAHSIAAAIGKQSDAMLAAGHLAHDGSTFPSHLRMIRDNKQKYLERLGDLLGTAANPQASTEKNHLYQMRVREYELLEKLVGGLHPGRIFDGYDPRILLSVSAPELLLATSAGHYAVQLANINTGEIETLSLERLLSHEIDITSDGYEMFSIEHAYAGLIDQSQHNEVEMRRVVLQGNLFEAARISLREKFGRSVVYTDSTGARRRAIMCPSTMTWGKMMRQPPGFNDERMLLTYLNEVGKMYTGGQDYVNYRAVKLTSTNGKLSISAPQKLFREDGDLALLAQSGRLETETKARDMIQISMEEALSIIPKLVIRYGGFYARGSGSAQRAWQEKYYTGEIKPSPDVIAATLTPEESANQSAPDADLITQALRMTQNH